MTEIIVRGRQGGKTDEMIRRSADNFAYIVCPDRRQAQQVFQRSKELGLDIPFPLTASEFFGGQFHGRGIGSFMFDNLDQMIQQLAGSVPVLAVTWTDSGEAAISEEKP